MLSPPLKSFRPEILGFRVYALATRTRHDLSVRRLTTVVLTAVRDQVDTTKQPGGMNESFRVGLALSYRYVSKGFGFRNASHLQPGCGRDPGTERRVHDPGPTVAEHHA